MKTRSHLNISLVVGALFFVVFSFGFSFSVAHAQINSQGMGGVLIQCSGVINKVTGALGEAAGRSVKTSDDATASVDKKENCQDAIARYAISELIAKLTQEALNWINSGFKGDPGFVKNPAAYLQSIATQKQTEFLGLLQHSSEVFPYGRQTAQSIALAEINKGFSRRARYTLNSYVPTGNANDFHRDFRIGGWNAFFHQAFEVQNNPVGFALLASEENGRITDGLQDVNSEVRIAQRELAQNGGFLNLKVCKESMSEDGQYISPADAGLFETEAEYAQAAAMATAQGSVSGFDQMNTMADMYLRSVCKTWETETPGSLISHALNKTVIDIPFDQAIAADEMNEALNVVFSALLSQVFSNGVQSLQNNLALAQDGLNSTGIDLSAIGLPGVGLGDAIFDPTSALGQGAAEAANFFGGLGSNSGQIETSQGIVEGWINQGQEFNIYNQLPYIIYITKRYAGSEDYNNDGQPDNPPVLPEGIDEDTGEPFYDPAPGFNGILEHNRMLFETIVELEKLDVCIPGPRVGWEQYVRQRIQSISQQIYQRAQDSQDLGTAIGGLFDPGGIGVGGISETVQNNTQKAVFALQNAMEQFIPILSQRYAITLTNMPLVTPVANVEIGKIRFYQDKIAENVSKRNNLLAIAANLENIQAEITELLAEYDAGTISQQNLEIRGRTLINTFYSVMQEQITPEDLQELQSFAEVAHNQINYVNQLTDLCVEQKTDPDYTGQTRYKWYQSVSGNFIGTTPQNGGHFIAPQETLDYGQNDAGVIIGQIFGVLNGDLSGYTVLQTLGSVIPELANFSPGTQWFEDVIWPNNIEKY